MAPLKFAMVTVSNLSPMWKTVVSAALSGGFASVVTSGILATADPAHVFTPAFWMAFGGMFITGALVGVANLFVTSPLLANKPAPPAE